MLASDAEIGDVVFFRGEDWEVTDVTHFDKDEQVRLELTRWTENNEKVTEWFTFDAGDELKGDEPKSGLGGQV